MTKKDLELENKFLKLQLKVINDMLENSVEISKDELSEVISAIKYYCNNYESELSFIKENDLPYNFYNQLMTID